MKNFQPLPHLTVNNRNKKFLDGSKNFINPSNLEMTWMRILVPKKKTTKPYFPGKWNISQLQDALHGDQDVLSLYVSGYDKNGQIESGTMDDEIPVGDLVVVD